jgi:acetyltransferase-like isoleucine patch superfamily enzyme
MSGVPDWHHLPPNRWNPHAWVVGEPEIGDGCWIGAFTVVDGSGGLTIGTGCDISAGAQIYTHSTVRRAVSAGHARIERAPTVIGDHVHVGAGAVVLMGCTIGSHSVIGAGAVVLESTSVPPWSLVIGVPARIVLDGARGLVPESAAETRGEDAHEGAFLRAEPGTTD